MIRGFVRGKSVNVILYNIIAEFFVFKITNYFVS